MSIGLPKLSGFDFDKFKKTVSIEQVVRSFGITIESNHKILCPNHSEKTPSCHVYEDYAYCYGCKQGWNSFDLAWKLKEKQDNKTYPIHEIITWLETYTFQPKSGEKFGKGGSKYLGAVASPLIDYWAGQMTAEKYQKLQDERLFSLDTIKNYKLGWRPDYEAWVIPFWSGEPGKSDAEIVQFRMTSATAKSKYVGLAGHQRGAVMNAHLLETTQDYVVILFGAFDGILALQDGLSAVSLNGCMPFKKEEKARVQKMFEKQHTIFIVPDNTPAEYQAAYDLAEWLKAEVRFFPPELPDGTDYIDYRKQGHSVQEFKQQVLGIEPILPVNQDMIENVTEYIKVGDPKRIASVHVAFMGNHDSPIDIARTIATIGPIGVFDVKAWSDVRKKLWRVTDLQSLITVLDSLASLTEILRGTW